MTAADLPLRNPRIDPIARAILAVSLLFLCLTDGFAALLAQDFHSIEVYSDGELVDAVGAGFGFSQTCPLSPFCLGPLGSTILYRYARFSLCLSGPDWDVENECLCGDFDLDGAITLKDYALFQLAHNRPNLFTHLLLEQRSALGYCPEPGSVSRAEFILMPNNRLIVSGTLSIEGDPNESDCIGGNFGPGCFVEIGFVSRYLTSSERSQLNVVLNTIPNEGCDRGCVDQSNHTCCGVYDPCTIKEICGIPWGADNDYCYGCGNSVEYRAAIGDVFEFVRQLVSD